MPVTDITHDLDARTITIVADFAAPVERVFDVYADPRQLELVLGPPDAPATVVDHELAPGGRVTYFMTGPDGEKHHGRWRIEEVEPPHRLHITDDAVGDEGKPDDGGPTAMTVTIAETDGTATMSIQTHFADRESMEQMIEKGMEQGMTETLNQVDPLLGAARK